GFRSGQRFISTAKAGGFRAVFCGNWLHKRWPANLPRYTMVGCPASAARKAMPGPKIAFIGAGSTVFAKNLMVNILSLPELSESTRALMEIDEERLKTAEIVAHRVARTPNANPTSQATTDRREALVGADYVICMIQVAG